MKPWALIAALAAFLLLPALNAETVCYPAIPGECTIRIEINIAFSYNDSEISQQQIDAWVKEIENTWNGENGYQTYGDCDCKVKFQVNTMKITNASQANCNPGPPGYHCIMVTDHNKNQPKNAAGNQTYRGYMYGVSQNGSSTNGWWSNEMGEPHPDSPTGENALDAAHEAGHMLGLGDDYDKGPPPRYGKNIMGTTHGPDAKPTQDQIDDAVENNCGEGACPDECCCGNGVVEDDKGEMCDPMADPTGCGDYEDIYCCKICCQCHRKECLPELGSYATQDDCKAACKDGTCYFNYGTGCWDCKEHEVVETPSPKTSEPARPEPTGGMLGIAGIVALIIGGGLIFGGVKKENKSFLIGGGLMAVFGVLVIFLAMMTAVVEKPIGVTKAADSSIGSQPMGSAIMVMELPGPEPQPAEDPEEEVLKNRKAGNESIIPAVPEEPTVTCGDRKCSVTENCSSCAQDCGACRYCGDRICSVTENCSSCQTDCGRCPYCGDGKCLGGETCSTCSRDCGRCPPVCGDGDCEGDEDCESCEEDCGECGPECGNDKCEVGENCECSDCECPPGLYCNPEFPDADPVGCSHFGGATCGNGLCDETEYCYTCPPDCKCGPETCCSPSNPGIGCGADCSWIP